MAFGMGPVWLLEWDLCGFWNGTCQLYLELVHFSHASLTGVHPGLMGHKGYKCARADPE